MAGKFAWKDRPACIRRCSVLITCTFSTIDEAIEQALYKTEPDGEYRYCKNPQLITPAVRLKLMGDVLAYQGIPQAVIAAGRRRRDDQVTDAPEQPDGATA